jgi:uncharacterized protein YuzE
MTDIGSFYVAYDRGSDVLYISSRREPAARGEEAANGIVWRFSGDGELIGATILDFLDYWIDRQSVLASELSQHFHIPELQAMDVVERAVSRWQQ